MDSELQKFEAELERLSPGRLPDGLISRMEAAMEGWEAVSVEVTEEIDKVVPFPKQEETPELEARNRTRTGWWAAAASVALLGGVAAMVFTAEPSQPNLADAAAVEAETTLVDPVAVSVVEYSPMTAKRTILDAADLDVIIPNGSQPMRMRRIDLVDRVVFLGPNGEEVHVERPSVNYQLVPVPTD